MAFKFSPVSDDGHLFLVASVHCENAITTQNERTFYF